MEEILGLLVYQKTQKALSDKVNLLPNVQDDQGNVVTNREQIAEVVTAFYESLYSDDRIKGVPPDNWQNHLKNNERLDPIRREEVSVMIRK